MIQQNFPVKTNATEMLFMQHIMKYMKVSGKASIVIPEGVLFNTGNAFQEIKKIMLEDFNLHSIVSLPAGVFLPYSGVKTNVIFFDREWSTKDIWFYEINLGRKLTKNKPLKYSEIEHIPELLKKREVSDNSWIVNVEDVKDFDISAKNPNKKAEAEIRKPDVIIKELEENEQEIGNALDTLKKLF